MYCKWKDTYKIGIEEIDRPHEQLFALFNEFVAHCHQHTPLAILLTQFHSLIGYVEEHFAEEEQIMQDIGYPQFADHKDIHTHLLHDAKEVEQDLSHASDSDDMLPFIQCLQSLIVEHILRQDSQIKAH